MACHLDTTMHRSTFELLFAVLGSLLFITDGASADINVGLDPVKNYCSRYWHQSLVKNDVLYIDSGVQKYNGSDVQGGPILGIMPYILTIPLNYTWNWKNATAIDRSISHITINTHPKNESNPKTGTVVPSQIRSHMFQGLANTTDVYLFGGTTYMGNQSFQAYAAPDSSQYPLWSYSIDKPDSPWMQYDISEPWMVNHGAAAEAVDQGLAFYLNGQIDWGTSAKTRGFNSTDLYTPIDGMLVVNMVSQTSSNISTNGLRGDNSRVGGSMEYIAEVGAMGILVALGGHINRDRPVAKESEGELLDFSQVDIWDINSYLSKPESNGSWYTQNTTGDTPQPRIDFCTVVSAAQDNSSYEIYLYGGHSPLKNGTAFDDVYILSIPSFTWTNVFANGGTPRWGHNCHIAGPGMRQMITVGGNVTSAKCDWEAMGVAMLEMTDITWGSVFLHNMSDYQVPRKVVSVIGGDGNGSATLKEPRNGWNDEGLKTLFNKTRNWSTGGPKNTNETTSEESSSHAGAIAGGVVGGVAGLALIAGALFFWRRRRQKAAQPHEVPDNDIVSPELPAEKKHSELQGLNENNPAELPGPDPVELNAPREFVEAPQDTATGGAVELPAREEGIPMVRKPGDDLPEQPVYVHGLKKPQKSNREQTSESSQQKKPQEPDQETPPKPS